MTVVNPKSISGINSITMASGSDNLLTIHTTNTTERVRVNSDGDVIVGSGITVSPDGDIFATGVTTSTTFVGALTGNVTGNISGGTVAGSTGTFTGDVDIADKIVHTGDTNTAIRFPAADTFTVETGGSERLRVSSNGKVRVGSGDASYNLDVKGSGQQVILVGSTDAGGAFITLDGDSNGDGSGTDYSYIGHNTDGDLQIGADNPSGNANIIFYAGDNAESARIDSSGRLLLGTTTEGESNANNLTIAASGQSGITLRSGSSNDGAIFFSDATSGSGEYAGFVQYNHTNDKLNFGTSSTARAFVDSSGNFNISNGNLVIGTSGKGIDFSATGDGSGASNVSELLDDYEEGTFSVTLSSGGTGVSFTHNKCAYTKIGRQVNFQMYIQMSGTANSDHLQFDGFPFTSVSYTNGYGGAYLAYSNNAFQNSGDTLIYFVQNNTRIAFYRSDGTSINGNSGLIFARDFILVGSYFAA